MESFISVLTTIGIIVGVILLFNFMIFVHELGHFLAARWRGLYVDRFQIWFGRPLWKKRINGVQWGVGWIPAGGFVSLPQMAPMEAIEGEASLPKGLKPVSPVDKIIVAIAGPLSSFALAVFFSLLVWYCGKPEVERPITTIGYVVEGSAAEKAGLKPGDKILEIDGHAVDRWSGDMKGVIERIVMGENDTLQFLIERPGVAEPILIESSYYIPETSWWQRKATRKVGFTDASHSVVRDVIPGSPADLAGLSQGDVLMKLNGERLWSPLQMELLAEKGEPMQIEVRKSDGSTDQVNLVPALPANWEKAEGAVPITGIYWNNSVNVRKTMTHPTPLAQLSQSLRWMRITVEKVAAPKSDVGLQHLSGPVGIVNYFHMLFVSENGWRLVLWFAVFLNVNLAILNMLPMPVVDGGHVVMNLIELVVRRPINSRAVEWIQVGFVFVILGFFLFVTSKDVGDLLPFGKSKEAELPDPQFNQVDHS